jgi:hypothetical protein
MPESREWIVTIGGRIEEATDNQVFLTLFEVALTSDPAARIIQFNEPTWPHTTSAVVQISAVNEKAAEAVGLDILHRIASFAIIGDRHYGWTARGNCRTTSFRFRLDSLTLPLTKSKVVDGPVRPSDDGYSYSGGFRSRNGISLAE